MAHIRKREKSDGSYVYDCAITIKKHGVIVHRESKTFKKAKLAKDYGMRREVELQETDVYKKKEYIPIKLVIQEYIKNFNPSGRSKLFDLTKLLDQEISTIDVNKLTAKDLIDHIKLRNKVCLPQTAQNDLIWLHAVIKPMKAMLPIDLNLDVFQTAREVLRQEGLIARSTKRERLPTRRELLKLTRYLDKATKNCMWFALYSSRRQSEITRLRWDDINHEKKTILVRDLKNPRIKKLSKTAKLPKSAYKLVMKQQQNGKYIFPYNSKTIGTYFGKACKMLDIQDLHFHDLRHAAITNLASKGLNLMELRLVSLHSNYSTLQRYVNLDPGDLDI